ncbi:hypothetical protein nACB1_046 [Acinetobacter phage nACB1]|nr:hypothetical protein nACB1_046 [Acinetobacter phage nACB1]
MTLELLVGILIGLSMALLAGLLTLLVRKDPKPKALTIDDLKIPPCLPLFKNHTIERGVNVNDTHIIMSWTHKDCSSQREYKIHTLTSTEDFKKAWRKHEVDFYLNNVRIFGKSLYKKRAKK